MEKKKFIKSVKALALCGLIAVSALSYTGCTAKANKKNSTNTYTNFTLECCGTAKLYNYVADKNCGTKNASLSGCRYFNCNSNTGKYCLYSNGKGITIWTVKSGASKKYNEHSGTISGKVITIAI